MSFSHAERDLVLTHVYELCRRPNPSGSEELVRAYVMQCLTACHFSVEVDMVGNITAWRGEPVSQEGYPLLSFHMDSVTLGEAGTRWGYQAFLENEPVDLLHSWRKPLLEGGVIHSGGRFILGGDDKCGAAIALSLAASTSIPLKIVGSVQEEVGCWGIMSAESSFFDDASYALVLDRRERHDLVTSIHGQSLCHPVFASALIRAAAALGHQVRPVQGMLSDALYLADWIENVANLSVGYYCPHSPQEYIVIAHLLQAYQWVYAALHTLPRPRPTLVDHRCPFCGRVWGISRGIVSRGPVFCSRCFQSSLP